MTACFAPFRQGVFFFVDTEQLDRPKVVVWFRIGGGSRRLAATLTSTVTGLRSLSLKTINSQLLFLTQQGDVVPGRNGPDGTALHCKINSFQFQRCFLI